MVGILHILMLGGLVFLPPKDNPDLALTCALPANAKAEPVEMPHATAFLKSSDAGQQLEDRFDVFDLWRAEAIRGRWRDQDGSRFAICRIPRKLPGDSGGTRTRRDFAERYSKATLGPKELDALDMAVELLVPGDVTLTERFAPRRAQRQNLVALWQYGTTNENAAVFAFRPRIEGRLPADWYLVTLVSDDPEAWDKLDRWLDDVQGAADAGKGDEPKKGKPKKKVKAADEEVALLAESYRRNVVNYDDWHFASASNLVVVDNMTETDRRPFIAAMTNILPRMQAAYRVALPSPLIDDTHIAAVRIFASREEYLAYVGVEMKWSAALWNPQHRELVLFYPPGGSETLLRTVWHEALHQHLDYACSMIQTPPWFNEGHAELFERTHFDMDGRIVFDLDPDAVAAIKENTSALAEYLPTLFDMDYSDFYAGTGEDRQLKYQLAWSLAYFLQVGAPKVRFQPFKNLRTDMMREVVRTGRRDDASRIVMTELVRKDLIYEWRAFWRKL